MGSEKKDNLDRLYDALSSDGLVQKSREHFRSNMLAPGMQGYRNRLALYKALKSDGLVKSGSYEEFSGHFIRRSGNGGGKKGSGPSRLMMPSDLGGGWKAAGPAAEPQGTVVNGGGKVAGGGSQSGGYGRQMRDELDYTLMTGGLGGSLQDLMPDVWDPLRGDKAVALERDAQGKVVTGSDGNPRTVVVADKGRAAYEKDLKEGADARMERLADGYDDRPVKGFWEGAKQGSNLMWQGLKSFAGEALNLFGSNASDERAAVADIEAMEGGGISGEQLRGAYIKNGVLREALEATGYDLEKAKEWLEEKGGREFGLGDRLVMEAKGEIDRARPTEGFAAWAGNLAPQMVPSAVGMAVGALTKNQALVRAVGAAGLSSAALSTAGLSMQEARAHGATNGQTWAVGLADAAIECVTEKIPFDRYTKRLVSGGKRRVARQMADAVSVAGSPAQKELGRLLEEASGKLGGRLLSGRNVKEFMADVAAEGASEFVAEALETVTPMVYLKPEEYPALSEILENGFEGMKGGLFMGSVLGGLSHVARRSQERSRWKEQGGVYAGRTAGGDVVEIVGHDKERGVFSVLRDGVVSEVAKDDMEAAQWFGYDEFMSGMLQRDADAGYEAGYSETVPEGMNGRKNLAEVRRKRVVELLGGDVADLLDEYGAEFAEELELEDAGRDAVLRYLEAKSAFDGMVQRVRDGIDVRLEENAREIDANVNREDAGGDGMVHPAVMKVGDRRVYVVGGRAVMSEDGTVVDTARSDESVVVRDAETGELEMVSPDALLRVEAAVDAEAEKAESGARIREAFAEEAAGLIDGRVLAVAGEVYEVVDGEGVRHSVRVGGGDDGSGVVSVYVDGNEDAPVAMGLEELQAGVDAARMADVEAREAGETGPEAEAAGTAAGGGDRAGDGQAVNRLEQGQVADIGPEAEAAGTADGGGDRAGDGQAVNRLEQGQVADIGPEAEAAGTVVGEPVAIPVEKRRGGGERVLYHRVPVWRTLEDLYDGSLDQGEIDAFVDNLVADAERRLKDAEGKEVRIGSDKADYLRRREAAAASLEDARDERDYYVALREEIGRITRRNVDAAGGGDAFSGEPQTLEEVAAMYASMYKVNPDSLKAETGMSNAEMRQFVGLLDRRRGDGYDARSGGVSIERLSEIVAQSDEWAKLGGDHGDDYGARSMLIDVYKSGNPRAFVRRAHEARVAREREDELASLDAFAWSAYHMGGSDYLSYEESVIPMIIERYRGFDFDRYFAILSDEAGVRVREAESNYNNSNRNDDGREREGEGYGGGGSVLPSDGSVYAAGAGTSVEAGHSGQGGSVGAGVQGSGKAGALGEEAREGGYDGRGGDGSLSGRERSDWAQAGGNRLGRDASGLEVRNSKLVGNEFVLSDKKAGNGEYFYQDKNGNINLAEIPEEVFEAIDYRKAPVRLTPSMIEHMMGRHGRETGASDVDKSIAFILDVMNNFDHVRLGYNGALVFSIENGREKTGKRAISILLSSKTGDFYGIVSSGYEGVDRLKKRPKLWAGSAVVTPATDSATEPVTTLDAQQGGEQIGSASGQSGLSETVSADKGTTLPSNPPTSVEKKTTQVADSQSPNKEITPEQSSLLERPNFAQYPAEQELSAGKGRDNSGSGHTETGKSAGRWEETGRSAEPHAAVVSGREGGEGPASPRADARGTGADWGKGRSAEPHAAVVSGREGGE
ncbi:MAG: hypothetical protein ACI4OZ_09285, partial [Akkermansia sp.]